MEGTSERDPVRCAGCGARYCHPRLALLLSLALPGLGSLYQRRWVWGGAVFLAGTGAFGWAVWRVGVHLRNTWNGNSDPLAMLAEWFLGVALVALAFGLDLLVVWVRRAHLVRLPSRPGRPGSAP